MAVPAELEGNIGTNFFDLGALPMDVGPRPSRAVSHETLGRIQDESLQEAMDEPLPKVMGV